MTDEEEGKKALLAAQGFAYETLEGSKRIVKDINFLNHIGFFCHDAHNAKKILEPQVYREQINIDGQAMTAEYSVTPHPDYGYPGPTAFALYNYIDQMLTELGPVRDIPYETAFLRKYLGLKSRGADNNKKIWTALQQLRHTEITTKFYKKGNKKWVATTYSPVINLTQAGTGERVLGGVIELNPIVVESFENRQHFPVNFSRYRGIPSAAQVLFLTLYRSFSTIIRKGVAEGDILNVSNDYERLCRRLNLAPRKHLSQARQQFEPYLKPLKSRQLISGFNIEPSIQKTNGKINIVCAAGVGFYEDYERFNTEGKEKKLSAAEQQRAVAFRNLINGQLGIGVLSPQADGESQPKDTMIILSILENIPDGEDAAFLAFAVKHMAPPLTLTGLHVCVQPFLDSRKLPSTKKAPSKTTRLSSDQMDEQCSGFLSEYLKVLFDQHQPGLSVADLDTISTTIKKKAELLRYDISLESIKKQDNAAIRGLITATHEEFVASRFFVLQEFQEYLKLHDRQDLASRAQKICAQRFIGLDLSPKGKKKQPRLFP